MKVEINVIATVIVFVFGVLVWIANDFVKRHVPMTAFGVLIACFFANASVLLPSSSILIAIEYSMVINPIAVAFFGAVGSALGEMIGFQVGRCGRNIVPRKIYKWLENRMKSHGYTMVLLFAVIPLPFFDLIGMLSGVMRMNAIKFYSVCFIGKLIKLTGYIWLAYTVTTLLG